MLVNLSHLSPLGIHALAAIIAQWLETPTQERTANTLTRLLDFTQNNQTKLLTDWMADNALLMQDEDAYSVLLDCYNGFNDEATGEMAQVVFNTYARLFYGEYTALQTRLLDSLKDTSDAPAVFSHFVDDMIAKHATLLTELATESQNERFGELFW